VIEVTETEEQNLERYLQRSGPLSRAYLEMGDERPSAALDQAIISRARAAIAEQRRARAPRWRWAGITALAATVLLSFGLVMRIALEPQSTPAGAATDKQRADSEPTTPSPRSERTNLATPDTSELGQPAASEPAIATSERLAPAPASNTSVAAPMLDTTSAAKEDAKRLSNEQDEGLSRVPRRQKAAGARHEQATAEKAVAQPAVGIDAARSPEPAAAPAESQMAAPPDYGTNAPAKNASTEALQKTGLKPPEEWLDEIARLRAEGDEEAAEREYAEFRKAYPDYVYDGATTPTR
jgi:hypothetical protein